MKKIIGLIMIAGISYGASVVTPPGIQVNGLATNNNVMVYSNGMLLDSGVAPTNLVSVTNLTAGIEALSATNAAQDALIADNTYAEGTANKNAIDTAIAASSGGGNRIALIDANSKTNWYESLITACEAVQDGNAIIVYPGVYNEVGSSAENVPLAHDLTITGVGRPRINISIPDTNTTASALRFTGGTTNLIINGLDFYITSDDADSSQKYGIILSGVTNGLVRDCRIQWDCFSTGNTTGNKTFVAVGAAKNVRVVGGAIVTRDLGTSNSMYVMATHDSIGGVVFENVVFVNENVDDDDVGSLSVLDGCYANDLSIYQEADSAVQDQRPWLASNQQISSAMIFGGYSDLTTSTGIDLVRSEFSRNSKSIVIGQGLQTVIGVQGEDYSCIPSNFSGTIYVMDTDGGSDLWNYGAIIQPDDNVSWTFKFIGSAKWTQSASSSYWLRFGYASNFTCVVEGFDLQSLTRTSDHYCVSIVACTNSTLIAKDCNFAFYKNASKEQTLYQSGVGNKILQVGGRVMTTDNDWTYAYGLKAHDVLVYTNDTWLADPDYVKSDF